MSSSGSVILDYNKSSDSTSGLDFGTRAGTVTLQQPIILDNNRKKGFRVLRVILTPEIPNIYSYGNFDSTTINISNNAGTNWVTVQMKTGIYTIQMIQDSVNSVANQLGWYTNAGDPAIIISYNPATQYIYTKLDSTKLAGGGQIGIDYSVSQIFSMMGYAVGHSTLLADGLYTAQNPPVIDSQGTWVDIKMSCIQNTRWVNGQLSNTICRVPLQTTGGIEIVWPSANTGMVSPIVPASIPSIIQQFTINFLTNRGNELVVSYGNVSVEVEIMDL